MATNQNQSPEQVKQTLWILWSAMLFFMVTHAALGTYLHTSNSLPPSEWQYSLMLLPFVGISILSTLFITVFWDKVLTPPNGELNAFFTPFILRMALAESIGLFGLFLCFVNGPLWVLFAFIAWGMALQVSLIPSENAIRAFREKYGSKRR